MSLQSDYKLIIEKDFKKLIPPLATNEFQQLEENIVRDGCREPLCVWNNTILDGHNRYEICTRLGVSFSIQRIVLINHEEAVAWICTNQLGRRNITLESRKYLIGKRYEMEIIIGIHNIYGINQHSRKEVGSKILTEPRFKDTALRTREKLGKEYNISDGSVYRYGVYAHAMDSLSRVSPELVPRILSGEVNITFENIVNLTKLPDPTVKRLCKTLSNDKAEFIGRLQSHTLQKQREKENLFPSLPSGSIKDMPSYDPDAEISALALTIPSWSSSIRRTYSVVDLSNTTSDACSKLEKELIDLNKTIELMLLSIKEVI